MNETVIEKPAFAVPVSVYAARRDRLRAKMRKAGFDCLLIRQASDRFYLSGFELHDGQPDESSGCLIIAADGTDWLLTDGRFRLAAEQLWPSDRIYIYSGDSLASIAKLLGECGLIIGIPARSISWHGLTGLRRYLPSGARILPCPQFVARMREIKEPEEIGALKKSFALNHAMFDWLGQGIEAARLTGIPEAALAWEIEKFFRENGAEELAFSVIAAAGKNGALPHAVPSASVDVTDGPLLVDAGCRLENYCSDQTRSFWIGKEPAPEFARSLELVREAQARAMEIMKPGVKCSDVHEAAKSVFARAGVEKAFTHGLGHGIGLQTHEAPSLSPASKQVLQEGMVITVEPGLYFPEWGGVRIEHTVLVEKDGVSVL